MEIKLSGFSNDGGIYKIVNKENNRIYYGSTSRFKKRFKEHKNNLEMNRHTNTFLQNDFNKCGTSAFLIEIVEVVNGEKKERLNREQAYIDQVYDYQKNCYNLKKDVLDTRESRKNIKPSDRENDLRCKPHTEEHKQKQSVSLKETWQQQEYREISRQNAHKQWQEQSQNNITVTNKETGEKVIINGSVRQFCLDQGLSYKAFHQLIKGKLKSSGGWFIGEEEPEYTSQKGQIRKPLSEEHKQKIAGGKFVGQKLVNDNGEEIIISLNVKQQCRELKLPYTTLLKVLKKECKSVCGYRLTM